MSMSDFELPEGIGPEDIVVHTYESYEQLVDLFNDLMGQNLKYMARQMEQAATMLEKAKNGEVIFGSLDEMPTDKVPVAASFYLRKMMEVWLHYIETFEAMTDIIGTGWIRQQNDLPVHGVIASNKKQPDMLENMDIDMGDYDAGAFEDFLSNL